MKCYDQPHCRRPITFYSSTFSELNFPFAYGKNIFCSLQLMLQTFCYVTFNQRFVKARCCVYHVCNMKREMVKTLSQTYRIHKDPNTYLSYDDSIANALSKTHVACNISHSIPVLQFSSRQYTDQETRRHRKSIRNRSWIQKARASRRSFVTLRHGKI